MKNRRKRVLILALILLSLITASFFIYVSDYSRADSFAISTMQSAKNIRVEGNLTIISPSSPGDTAMIFYPGGKVEHTAYIPILEKLSQKGITCILVQMPFNLAVFDINAADKVFDKLPDIKNWYIGGHSLGGVMASSYAAKHIEKIKGLILLGAYIYGSVPPEKALTIYGTLNSDLEKNIKYTENIVIIDGGNHAQFGNYGPQKGDPPATISTEVQQNIAVAAIMDFVNNKNKT